MPPTPSRPLRDRWPLLGAAVFALGLATLWPLLFEPPARFDEGFIVSGAMMVRRGWWPVRDFFVIYGPAQYYAVAALFSVFGENLAFSRAMHLATLALIGAAVARHAQTTSRRHAGWVALTAAAYLSAASFAAPLASYPALPAVLLLLWSVHAFERWVETGAAGALAAGSALVGAAGLYRWDFGVLGVAAHAAAVAAVVLVRRRHAPLDRRGAPRPGAAAWVAACVVGPWLALMLGGFGSLVVAGDAARWLAEVPGYAVHDFATWRGVSFVGPQVLAAMQAAAAGDGRAVVLAAARLGYAALPFALVGAALSTVLHRWWRGTARPDRADAVALLLALLALGLLNQMRVRPALAQGFPAVVAALPLAAWLLHRPTRRDRAPRAAAAGRALLVAATVVACVLPAQRLRSSWPAADMALGLPKAGVAHARAWNAPELRDYAALVAHLRATTAPGEPIFSGVADTSRLFTNDAMLYFIADRPAPTRWIEMEPGLTNTAAGQREVIAELERARVRVVVLFDRVSDEPNATARSNGVGLLDAHLRERFEPTRRFGAYEVRVRRSVP